MERKSKSAGPGSQQYLALFFEYLGIQGTLPLIGYFIDTKLLSDKGEIGWAFGIGMGLGLVYGMIHLYRRARSMTAYTPPSGGERLNREGYPDDVSGKAERIRNGMNNIGKRINRLKDDSK